MKFTLIVGFIAVCVFAQCQAYAVPALVETTTASGSSSSSARQPQTILAVSADVPKIPTVVVTHDVATDVPLGE